MVDNRSERDWNYIIRYEEQVAERIASLKKLKLTELPTAEERVSQAEAIIEEFRVVTGRNPKPALLSQLANYILGEDLKDKDIDKVTNNAYPILSEYQIKRREQKQISMIDSSMDFLEVKINKGLDSLARTPVKRSEY